MTCGRTQDGEVMMTERDSVATSLPLLAMTGTKDVTNVLDKYALFTNAKIIAIISYVKVHNIICRYVLCKLTKE
jgi:hypothetical protein